ncbi:nuclear transport factor 2 family protein [Hellea balneolensis]|uniref:nuclear transport factor 2 family protein n=1 Tax=Hellea balneolensis TaxID=287478 RepID=UPI00040D10F5|nr:nuclear transport factor 2 family protein [Hellea balneolensis]
MSLEDRISRVEAELAIRNVIARYGMAADCGDIETALACHMEDAVYVVSNPNAGRGDVTGDLELKGHSAISDMLSSEIHQSLLPNCAHTVGPLLVEVDGHSASVLGYSRVYHNQKLMRLAVNSWTMRKEESWKIARRESRVIGEDEAQTLLNKGLQK